MKEAVVAAHPSRRESFTLLELLVVVILLGVLTGIAFPNFTKFIEKGRVRDAQVILNMIYQGERLYYLDQGSYGTLAQLTPGGYVSAPDADDSNPDWDFILGENDRTDTTFTATAERTGAAGDADEIQLDQDFTGYPIPDAPYNGKIYFGDHPLHD